MISSIRNCISISFNHLVIHAKKLNSLTSKIKEYVTHKFEDISCYFKHASFLGNNRFNSSNQPCTAQSNNENVNHVATATLNLYQPLTLDRLDKALKVWKNDPNAKGNKLEASQRIRQAFQNKSIDLNLCNLQLNNLPSIIGHLTQLKKLYLWCNQLQALPSEIINLTQLQTLDLRSNQLQALPAEIINLTQLKTLCLSSNQLEALPAEIINLTQLKTLSLSSNQLEALPAEIGNLTQLKTLYLSSNQNLAELPLSLGQLSELSFIDIDNTRISREACESILAQCQAKRKGDDSFILRLKKWFTLADVKDVKLKLDVFTAWDERHQDTTKEWLFRLEKTQDFQGNQKKLAQIVCNMFHNVAEDKEFKDLFMNQAEANNTACQDRSAMGLNELYTAWKIYLMEKDQTSSLQDKLCVLIQAGKTIALRGYLTDLINKQEKQNHRTENESVEIFLYYETALKKELNLLSVIERMSYPSIGKRDWIDVNQLKKEVNDQYITYLVDIPAFIATAKEDQYFKEQIDSIEAESRKKLEDLGEYPTNDEFSEEVLEWKTKMGEINEQHKQSRILMVKQWLEDQRLS